MSLLSGFAHGAANQQLKRYDNDRAALRLEATQAFAMKLQKNKQAHDIALDDHKKEGRAGRDESEITLRAYYDAIEQANQAEVDDVTRNKMILEINRQFEGKIPARRMVNADTSVRASEPEEKGILTRVGEGVSDSFNALLGTKEGTIMKGNYDDTKRTRAPVGAAMRSLNGGGGGGFTDASVPAAGSDVVNAVKGVGAAVAGVLPPNGVIPAGDKPQNRPLNAPIQLPPLQR